MTISLAKGQRIDLTKTNPGLTRVVVGLGWDTNKYSGGVDFDLTLRLFCCTKMEKPKVRMTLFFTTIQAAVRVQ